MAGDSPSAEGGEGQDKYQGPIDPDIYLAKIAKMSDAILIEHQKLEGMGPKNPYDFCKILLASETLSDEETRKILIHLHNSEKIVTSNKEGDYTEFYNHIPRFLKYEEYMNNIIIFNGNIYLSSWLAEDLQLDESYNLNLNDNTYIFFISIHDLFFSNSNKDIINLNNDKVISVNQNKYSAEWQYFKNFFMI